MRAAQLRATLLWALCSMAAAQEGVPRRGPPRGPIKEDKSTFFGKEGDQSHPCGNQPAVRAAAASRPRPPRRRAVARAVASKASSHTHRTQVAARGEPLHAVRADRLRAPARRPRAAPDLRDDGHGQGAGRDEEEAVVFMVSALWRCFGCRPAGGRRVIRNSSSTTNTRSEGLILGSHQSSIVLVQGPEVTGLVTGVSRASRSRWRETRSLAHRS